MTEEITTEQFSKLTDINYCFLKTFFDAALRRACENASGELGKHIYNQNCVFCQRLSEIIERHLRRELGL